MLVHIHLHRHTLSFPHPYCYTSTQMAHTVKHLKFYVDKEAWPLGLAEAGI